MATRQGEHGAKQDQRWNADHQHEGHDKLSKLQQHAVVEAYRFDGIIHGDSGGRNHRRKNAAAQLEALLLQFLDDFLVVLVQHGVQLSQHQEYDVATNGHGNVGCQARPKCREVALAVHLDANNAAARIPGGGGAGSCGWPQMNVQSLARFDRRRGGLQQVWCGTILTEPGRALCRAKRNNAPEQSHRGCHRWRFGSKWKIDGALQGGSLHRV
mmetsp:Transcript_101196/g.241272  ORF Transcript_101196/g.241272 Transcript_101196/m.241272 type:complete len:213 (-) Transcript_101196:24-662(-)